MCGIAGILGFQTPLDGDQIQAMVDVLHHRGPDASRVRSYPGAKLGHTRLSILDLSDHGLQPMESSDGRFVIVYNGEIYNFKELRRELEAGYRFQGHCDTEVLLAAYLKWGEDCLEHLNGMFAFCLYDTKERTAFLARDRFGQKPLYFHQAEGRLIFASEVKAILAAGVAVRPDLVTWSRYLATASYDDDGTTYFEDIVQLEPGECANWTSSNGRLSKRKYYDVANRIQPRHIDYSTAVVETRELLIDAARLHMRSDVPVAIALSGGLDSSAMLACLDQAGKLDPGVQCFSFEFDSDLSERGWIEAAASYHSIESRIMAFGRDNFRDSLTATVKHLEGPAGGLANCALNNVYRSARQSGFKVIQDGTGLDEAYGGYRNHHNLYLGHLLKQSGGNAENALVEYAGNWGVSRDEAYATAAASIGGVDGTAIDGTIPVRPDLLDASVIEFAGQSRSVQTLDMDPVRSALIDYLQVSKIPRNMRMKDRLSMTYSIELRLPFLDHRLIEHALSMPVEYLFRFGRSKSLVREALKDVMDEEVRTAVKRSIQAPQGKWLMAEPMRTYVHDLINSESFAARGLFDVAAVKKAFEHFCEGTTPNSFFVWQWINVEEWFRAFVDVNPLIKPPLLSPKVNSQGH
jgi:asparagine synthase (glutamine-hydrolysing)